IPSALTQSGVSLFRYYQSIDSYLGPDRAMNPGRYADIEAALAAFDPAKATAELTDRIVTPTRDAGALLRQYPYLTRLYTTLSPEDMNLDPVFSFNPGLPDVSNVHLADLTVACDDSGTATLRTGSQLQWLRKLGELYPFQPLPLPYAQRI